MLAKPDVLRDKDKVCEPKVQAAAQAFADTLIVSEGLERYREQHGAYPETLQPLASELPPELSGLYDGRLLSYHKREMGGYILSQRPERSQDPIAFESDGMGLAIKEAP